MTIIAPTSAELDTLIAYLKQQRREALAISAAADMAVYNASAGSPEHDAARDAAQAAEDSVLAAHGALLIARRAAAALASLASL